MFPVLNLIQVYIFILPGYVLLKPTQVYLSNKVTLFQLYTSDNEKWDLFLNPSFDKLYVYTKHNYSVSFEDGFQGLYVT